MVKSKHKSNHMCAKKKKKERENSLATITKVETFLTELMSIGARANILLLRGNSAC